MARQLDLLTPPGLRLVPVAGGRGPRFWVRRLVLWSEPGKVLRDVTLRPGLNIVWSPDPSDQGAQGGSSEALGHGSGKTLFCRLIRYCLGEERFAPEGQRDSIAAAFKNGLVGAEVILDGSPWAIIRPIGLGRRSAALACGNLDTLGADGAHATGGLCSFFEAVEGNIVSPKIHPLVLDGRERRSWLVALAWLARDQECRFGGVLDWRSTASDSGSPARNISAVQKLDALRALLGAIDPAEQTLRAEASLMEKAGEDAKKETEHRDWETKQEQKRIAAILQLAGEELPSGRLAVEVFRKVARDRLARVAQVEPSTDAIDLDALRAEHESARNCAETLDKQLAEVEACLPLMETNLRNLRAESACFFYTNHKSEHPLCQICEVPIDRVLAEGCRLSSHTPNLKAVNQRYEQCLRDLAENERGLVEVRAKRDRLIPELANARQREKELRERRRKVELARDERKDAWYSARRLLDDIARLEEMLLAQEEAAAREHRLITEIEEKREQAGLLRDEQTHVFKRISEIFDGIVRELVGQQARGRINLDGKGLHLAIELGGERSTAAIDSLKVLAFDLAALCMGIEGKTHVPPFLLHDSPREADLGLSAYHRIFRLARRLEDFGGRPLFQYILTTTTRPPEEMCAEPWLRLTLEGAPADRRLLRRDL